MAKKFLVTGGLGFIGASLVSALHARRDTVRVLDNSSRGSREKLGEGVSVEIIEGDIRDPLIVQRAVKGVDSVIHLAYVNGTEFFYKHPAYVLDVGVKGMVNVLDACMKHGIPELILASSSEVYQTPPTVPTDESVPLSIPDPLNSRYSYGGGKIISELLALNYGREHLKRCVIFRPHNVYGPMMGFEHVIPQFIERLKTLQTSSSVPTPFPIQGDGTQTRSFIFIDDFTAGLLSVIDRGEHLNIYHIGTMEEVTIRQLAEQVASCMDLRIAVQPGPEADGGTSRRCPDISKLKKLGFSPTFSLAAGLQPTVAWYRDHDKPLRSFSSSPSLFLP